MFCVFAIVPQTFSLIRSQPFGPLAIPFGEGPFRGNFVRLGSDGSTSGFFWGGEISIVLNRTRRKFRIPRRSHQDKTIIT